MTISHDDVAAYFTRPDGAYHFARWGRPLAPIVFGGQDETLQTLKGAFEVVCALAGHKMAETDPELGSNVMVFFFREWEELTDVPDLDRLIPDLAALVVRLKAGNASQYRAFRFDKAGAFQACFVFLRWSLGQRARRRSDAVSGGAADAAVVRKRLCADLASGQTRRRQGDLAPRNRGNPACRL